MHKNFLEWIFYPLNCTDGGVRTALHWLYFGTLSSFTTCMCYDFHNLKPHLTVNEINTKEKKWRRGQKIMLPCLNLRDPYFIQEVKLPTLRLLRGGGGNSTHLRAVLRTWVPGAAPGNLPGTELLLSKWQPPLGSVKANCIICVSFTAPWGGQKFGQEWF